MILRLLAIATAVVPLVTCGTALADDSGSIPPVSQCYSVAINSGPEVTVCQP